MSEEKRLVRERFRSECLVRDGHRCRACGVRVAGIDVNVHHITPRNEIPNGGYVLENGITLCHGCHRQAEACLATLAGASQGESHALNVACALSPTNLYRVIGSSRDLAFAVAGRA